MSQKKDWAGRLEFCSSTEVTKQMSNVPLNLNVSQDGSDSLTATFWNKKWSDFSRWIRTAVLTHLEFLKMSSAMVPSFTCENSMKFTLSKFIYSSQPSKSNQLVFFFHVPGSVAAQKRRRRIRRRSWRSCQRTERWHTNRGHLVEGGVPIHQSW